MTRLKSWLSLVLVAVLVLAAGLAPAEGAAETEIEIWAKDDRGLDFMNALAEAFHTENPGIRITYTVRPDYAGDIQSGAALPDILYLDSAATAALLRDREQLVYLDEMLSDAQRALFPQELFMEGVNVFDGKTFTLPSVGTTPRLVYNLDIFERVGLEEAPRTLEDLEEYAMLIAETLREEGIYGFAMPMADPAEGLTAGFTLLPMLDGSPVAEGYNLAEGQYDFISYFPYISAFAKIWETDSALPGCDALDLYGLRAQFAQGKVAMYMDYTDAGLEALSATQRWAYAPLPTLSGEVDGSQPLAADTGFCITTACTDVEAAFQALSYLYSAGSLTAYYEQGLGISIVPGVIAGAKAPEAVAAHPYMATQAWDRLWPAGPAGTAPEGEPWSAVFAELIMREEDAEDPGEMVDIFAALEDLTARYNAAYAAGGAEAVRYPSFRANDPAGTMEP